MNLERYLRLIAGVFVMGTVALAVWVNPWWLAFTAFVGLNLTQSAFTDWCPMISLLHRLGVPRAGECSRGNAAEGKTRMKEVGVQQVHEDLLEGTATLIDVREPAEYNAGHVPGAVHIPLRQLELRMAEAPTDRSVYVICHSGGRSASAVYVLAGHGIAAHNVVGGMVAWSKAGLPVEK